MEEEEKKPLDKYLKRGEGEKIEYKQTLNDAYKIAKTLCSLANTKGGILLIGVKDDGAIMGIDPEEEKHFLIKASEFHCRPPVPLEIEDVFVTDENNWLNEKVVLKVRVAESNEKPHYAENKKGEWIAYHRINDQNLIAGAQAVKLMQMDHAERVAELSKNELRLLDYLKENKWITLKRFTSLVNISSRRARKELQEALDKGIIRVLEHEKEDYYVI